MIAQPTAVTHFENFVEFVLHPDPQVLDSDRTPSMFPSAHICEATAPPKLTNVGELWLNGV